MVRVFYCAKFLQIANFAPKGLAKIPRPLLYTNMTLTKLSIASDGLTQAFLGLDRQTVRGSGYPNLT